MARPAMSGLVWLARCDRVGDLASDAKLTSPVQSDFIRPECHPQRPTIWLCLCRDDRLLQVERMQSISAFDCLQQMYSCIRNDRCFARFKEARVSKEIPRGNALLHTMPSYPASVDGVCRHKWRTHTLVSLSDFQQGGRARVFVSSTAFAMYLITYLAMEGRSYNGPADPAAKRHSSALLP